MDLLVADVTRQIQLTGEREVRSAVIGQLVMDALREVDEVAFVRYASVYRSFEDVSAFSTEVERLKKSRQSSQNVTQLSLLGDKAWGSKK